MEATLKDSLESLCKQVDDLAFKKDKLVNLLKFVRDKHGDLIETNDVTKMKHGLYLLSEIIAANIEEEIYEKNQD